MPGRVAGVLKSLQVYPAERVSLPVWERGVQVTGDLPGLSAQLGAEFVEEFEGRRDDLIDRRRAELGPGFQVLSPPRIP